MPNITVEISLSPDTLAVLVGLASSFSLLSDAFDGSSEPIGPGAVVVAAPTATEPDGSEESAPDRKKRLAAERRAAKKAEKAAADAAAANAAAAAAAGAALPPEPNAPPAASGHTVATLRALAQLSVKTPEQGGRGHEATVAILNKFETKSVTAYCETVGDDQAKLGLLADALAVSA